MLFPHRQPLLTASATLPTASPTDTREAQSKPVNAGPRAAGGTFRVSGRNVCSDRDKGLTFCACARERNDAKAEVPACD